MENPETSQLALWKSDFGRSYTDRNDHEKPERKTSWARILDGIPASRVLEVGCNVGWNLEYLRQLGVADLHGIEPQPYAVERARARNAAFDVVQGTAFELPYADASFDLVFTSGVLIHIAPDQLGVAMDEMYRVARSWIVAIEYDHPVETEVAYRGHAGALWKRDHRAAWQARHRDLRLVKSIELRAGDGYDDCTAHVLAKPAHGAK